MDLQQPVAWCIRINRSEISGKFALIPHDKNPIPFISNAPEMVWDSQLPAKKTGDCPIWPKKNHGGSGNHNDFFRSNNLVCLENLLGKKVGKGASKPSKFGGFSKLFGYQTDFLRTLDQIPQAESGTNQLASLIRWSKWCCFRKLDGSVWYTISIDCLLVVSISSPINKYKKDIYRRNFMATQISEPIHYIIVWCHAHVYHVSAFFWYTIYRDCLKLVVPPKSSKS